ncbi:MAG: transglycosylase family protein [Acidimicrobiales bacterium]|jgi:hypothetical protein
MRTRIALVAIVSIALITVTLLVQAVTVQPATASTRPPSRSTTRGAGHRTDHLTSFIRRKQSATPQGTRHDLHLGALLLSGHRVGVKETAPVHPVPAVPAIVDTVTPEQRSAWERVAICEEGGDWQADTYRFSGGLGITRSNWDSYGGLQYAPEGAEATPDEQIMVAERIQPYPPDQDGCRGW